MTRRALPKTMSHEIDFSIIVPTYQRVAQLRLCLASIVHLDYAVDRIEVIVVDDGSVPAVEPQLRGEFELFDCRFVRQENWGPARARNLGAGIARGRWLAFTDDDCAPRPTWLTAFATELEKQPLALLGGHTVNSLRANAYAQASQELIEYLLQYFHSDGREGLFFTSNNLATWRQTFLNMGGFHGEFRLPAAEDRELCDRWRSQGLPLCHVENALVDHAHQLSLGGYWIQHYTYGRGAPRYHQIRRHRGHLTNRGRTPEPLSFYLKLLQFPLKKRGWLSSYAWRVAALLLLSQVAYLSGVLRESIIEFFNRFQCER